MSLNPSSLSSHVLMRVWAVELICDVFNLIQS